MYSQTATKYSQTLSPWLARSLKKILVYPRYYGSLWLGRQRFKQNPRHFPKNILFVAGLPKSGTTWMENMLSSYSGFVPILPYQVTRYEMKHKSSCGYDFPEDIFEPLKKGLYVMKMHSHGSKHNSRILKENHIRCCIIYRDLRDAALSHFFYVRSTPWHPEYPDYKNLSVKQGLIRFSSTRLEEWAQWIQSWRKNRDQKQSLALTYEEMLRHSFLAFKKVIRFFDLNDSEEKIESVLDQHRFKRMKSKKGSFYRKGISGDWKNYFDQEIKDLYKEKVSSLLIDLGYEKDHDW